MNIHFVWLFLGPPPAVVVGLQDSDWAALILAGDLAVARQGRGNGMMAASGHACGGLQRCMFFAFTV